jgi:hypothetical protein
MNRTFRILIQSMIAALALSWVPTAAAESTKPQTVTSRSADTSAWQKTRRERRAEARARLDKVLENPPETAPLTVKQARAKKHAKAAGAKGQTP